MGMKHLGTHMLCYVIMCPATLRQNFMVNLRKTRMQQKHAHMVVRPGAKGTTLGIFTTQSSVD